MFMAYRKDRSGGSLPTPSLEGAIQAIRDAYIQVLLGSAEEEASRTEDRLIGALAPHVRVDDAGGIVLQDGSRLHIVPERGKDGKRTGRLSAVQRFADGQPERTHLLVPRRSA